MTPEDQKARDEFEAQYIARQRRRGYGERLRDDEFVKRMPGGLYMNLGLDDVWWAWQESRRTYRATPPCTGRNCATTTANHSPECVADHLRAVAGKE